ADMMLKAEAARSAVYYAACIADEFLGGRAKGEMLAEAASIAKAYCSDAYFYNAGCAIQMHGGIGFTWEHDAHLYFKRAKSTQQFLGDAVFHRERLSQQILGDTK
ncbi:MAG: acyl-CoA dehydrogenase family protein, partial [Gammaproteobacteria bacterium]|nr:acyl-CoA dehydrogenase family protein [Gammaproteobacteria bacterium]